MMVVLHYGGRLASDDIQLRLAPPPSRAKHRQIVSCTMTAHVLVPVGDMQQDGVPISVTSC